MSILHFSLRKYKTTNKNELKVSDQKICYMINIDRRLPNGKLTNLA